jgi:predicted PurR-regulated permease PerM
LAILILFFFLKDGRAILRHLGAILPLSLKQSDRLVLCVSQTLEANVHGVFAVALVQGILLFIGFLLFGLGSPLLWAFVGAFFSMIPVAGTGVVWVPAALSLCLSDRVPQGIGLAIWGFVVVGYADNIIRPLVVGSRARQHPLLVFFAMIGGILAFGLVGLLLGPIILASTFATIDLLREEFGMRSMTGSFLENQPVNRAMQVKTLEKSRTPRRTKLSPRRNAERHKSRLAE